MIGGENTLRRKNVGKNNGGEKTAGKVPVTGLFLVVRELSMRGFPYEKVRTRQDGQWYALSHLYSFSFCSSESSQ